MSYDTAREALIAEQFARSVVNEAKASGGAYHVPIARQDAQQQQQQAQAQHQQPVAQM